MIFFCHIQRAAGTTIHRYFAKPFGGPERISSGGFVPGARWLVLGGHQDLPAASEIVRDLPDRRFYLGGHIGLHDLAAAGIPAAASDIVLATVRNPVERAVSLFYLVQRSPEWFPGMSDKLAGRDFQYFYEWCRDNGAYFHNDHCRSIGGTTDFEQAKTVIQARFHLVGSTTAMPAFERALADICSPLVPGFRIEPARENAALHEQGNDGTWRRKVSATGIASKELIEKIEADNEGDARLVAFVERDCGGLFAGRPRAAVQVIGR